MATIIVLFNKPYGVLCQFTPEGDGLTLADFIPVKKVYPAGRLDKDSEGLVVLTDNGKLQQRIMHPKHKQAKNYWVQVENTPDDKAILSLRNGVMLKDGKTRRAGIEMIAEPEKLWPRNPPIRKRNNIPTSWLSITLTEGRNRQIRRMTAAVGLPTLRLIRYRIGEWNIDGVKSGDFIIIKHRF